MRYSQAIAGALALLLVGVTPAILHAQAQPPSNDLCVNAITGLAVPSVTAGTTVGATTDSQAPSCGAAAVTSPGVWYTVVGTGRIITADTCNGTTTYDSKLSAYCTNCTAFQCITGNDDFCGLQSQISWCSQLGDTYHILVHGFGGATGPFDLTLTDGGPCGAPVPCGAASAPRPAPLPVLSGGMVVAMALLLLGLGLVAVRRHYRRT